ncbi:hypothetical protein N7462_003569 [Penicillium macrosclerotiorum]|uniref:uncharacterized protein n=1 Tax=Penicillium macrosclerotiorum TaxID=303699 RepID=UPI0025474FF2|nr:uncharacterized protein N7462_003569 [Penicillium macrosclerotiorum]KAJ5689177.1 hypothetical protein N7462_003569 [Penicillium macrosclerotiorum]
MEFLRDPESAWRIGRLLIAATTFCSILYRFFPKALINRVNIRDRRNSIAKTPPRSLSPAKKQSNSAKPPINYDNALPPQRREALLQLTGSGIPCREVDETDVHENILPMTADYRSSPDNLYTPTGFSVGEVRSLGDFPDYATLSGVPLPSAYPEHDIEKAKPRPYRPFRWAYHQTMSLTKMETDWWIELESTYRSRIAQRKELYAKNGKEVLDALPGSELACKELMEMVLQFICARYPQHFTLVDKDTLRNHILGTQQNIRAKPPLEVLLDNVPEDFGLMMRDDETGYYFLRAAVICSALGWNVGSKIGKQLHQIHAPIPDYKEKMQFSMDRFFTKMPTEKPIQRGSWGFEVGEPLYMPPGDPQEALRSSQNPDLQIADCNLRVDWQTLRRLPLSASIVFNFKALFTPITEFRDEPAIPPLVAKILKEGKSHLMEYKGVWHVQHVILPQMEKWAKEQEEKGLVPKDWPVATLDESPWFQGWEKKWHCQQGF